MEYYVYQHKRLKDNSIFYIGKGKGERFNSDVGRNQYWNRIVRKDGGFKAEIVKDCLTNEEACQLEIKLINEIGIDNLSNLAEGGNGGNTRKGFTEDEYQQWLKNKSEAQRGRVGYWKDKKRPEQSLKIKKARERGSYNSANYSNPKSDEHKKSLSEVAKNRIRKIVKCDRCGKEVPNTHLAVHKKGKKCLV